MTAAKPLPPLTPADIARFWSKVHVGGADECWPWTEKAHRQGYGRLGIRRDGVQRGILSNRIAFFLFHGYDADGFVCHTCDNPPCCNGAHLYDGSQLQNMGDAMQRERHGAAHLKAAQVAEIRRRYLAGGIIQEALAQEFGVTVATICRLLTGKNWRHLPVDHDAMTERVSTNRASIGERNTGAKLNEAQVRVIRTRYEAGGITQAALAKEFGVTDVQVSLIVRRKSWTHVI